MVKLKNKTNELSQVADMRGFHPACIATREALYLMSARQQLVDYANKNGLRIENDSAKFDTPDFSIVVLFHEKAEQFHATVKVDMQSFSAYGATPKKAVKAASASLRQHVRESLSKDALR